MAQKKENLDLLICAGQVATPVSKDASALSGAQMQNVWVIKDGAIGITQGKIRAVGEETQLQMKFNAREIKRYPRASATPGLIDCHTHLVFAGSREKDFYARIAGASYEQIARHGGGIRESVRHLREASKDELRGLALGRLRGFLECGTTTCEIKSGYGLSTADEIKTLEVIEELATLQPISLIPTFLGAHEVPDEFRDNRGGYLSLLCDEMLPLVARGKLARFCDVFCEKEVFSLEESTRVLECAKAHGLHIKLHADELTENFGGAELAARLKATSADHLVMVSVPGIESLAKTGTVAVMLPATTFFLAKDRYAPARSCIEGGAALALATDLNPGSSNTENLQTVMTLAAVKLKMTAEEILTAVTHNAACALLESERVGRLQVGLEADVVVWAVDDYRKLPYHFGGNRALEIFKAGKSVCDRSAGK